MLRKTIFSLCAAGLLYGLFRQTPPPQLFDQSDKFGHFAGFSAMTFAGIWALSRKIIQLFIVSLIVLACSAEFIQQWFLPHRHFSLYDMYANLTGIAIIFLPWLAWRISRHFFSNSSNLQTSEKP
ncbi:VanZ family protein [uncultured Amphritea sp.]|uniref:VanZ family protein n=1 Tax=uncultured Amphritea sp. TaxID=981605 RepID=UPI0026256AD1|nr:VanZ family protein [uncultured Amphritea sp.]